MLRSSAKRLISRYAGDLVNIYLTHYRVHHRIPDLKNQPSFTDRIAFRRLYPQPHFAPLTDKVKVRDYVRERVGEQYLVPVYRITADAESIDFGELPLSFAMKASHGCGWNEFVRENDNRSAEYLRKKAQYWLSQNFYRFRRERHYKEIPPRIMFEELLTDGGLQPKDYKIHCFRRGNILTQIIQVHSDRFGDHKVNFYAADWSDISLSHGYKSLPPKQLPPPENLEEMLYVARSLSVDLNYVRVDLYSLRGRVYFGEMTFTPGAGLMRFNPICADKQWASLFDPDPYKTEDGISKSQFWLKNFLRPAALKMEE
jgi:hypothetical protein